MKYILFVVTSTNKIGTDNIKTGYEFSEVANPYTEFTKAGFTVDFATPTGGQAPEYGFDDRQENNAKFKKGSGFKRLNFSHKIDNINIDAYDAVFFPGGLGPMIDLANSNIVADFILRLNENKKIIAAVCHGLVALLNVKLSNGQYLLDGKNVTCFTEAEELIEGNFIGRSIPFMLEQEIKNRGVLFCKAEPFVANVIVDDNIITGQNPASAIGVAEAVIKKLIAG
jgi:putative intracellular protease/amidase